MQTTDFLKKSAQTPFCDFFTTAGSVCEIHTNSSSILQAARACFPSPTGPNTADFAVRFWVDLNGKAQPPWPKPYFRGSGHMIFGGFDSENSVLIDLLRRRILGRFSPAFASDLTYWKSVVFPRVLTAVGESIGLTELHCGCVARHGLGLVLAGDSGAGKSTMTLALTQLGFSFVSEDWTYFSRRHGRLLAWGLPTGIKLLPDAVSHFAELEHFETLITLNGERAYKIDPEDDFHLTREHSCQPAAVIFLERQPTEYFEMSEMSAAEGQGYLQANLMVAAPDTKEFQLQTIKQLVAQGCWRLRFGGSPRKVGLALAEFHSRQAATALSAAGD